MSKLSENWSNLILYGAIAAAALIGVLDYFGVTNVF